MKPTFHRLIFWGHLIAGLLAGHLSDNADVSALSGRFIFVFMTTAGAGVLMLVMTKPIRKLMGDVK